MHIKLMLVTSMSALVAALDLGFHEVCTKVRMSPKRKNNQFKKLVAYAEKMNGYASNKLYDNVSKNDSFCTAIDAENLS